MPQKTKKCPECNGCMSKQWILPNRYYYCEFCRTYYGGRDDNLQLIDKEIINNLVKENQNGGNTPAA